MKQLLATLTIGLLTGPVLAQSTIEQVAPENAVLVFGVRDATAVMQQLSKHPMFATLAGQGEEPGAAAEGDDGPDWMALFPEPLPALMREMRREGGALPQPQGAAGFAMFSAINPEIGMPEPEFLVYADYGDGAARLIERVNALLEKAGEHTQLQFQKRQLDGAEVISVKLPEPAPEPFDPMDDPVMGGQPMDPLAMMMPDADRFRIDTIHVARSGRSVLMGSDLTSVKRGLAALDGTNDLGVVADNRAFQGVVKQVEGSDAYGVVLTRDLLQLVMGQDAMGMAMLFTPMARSLFGEIQGMGYGLSTGNAADAATQRFTAYMPNGKQGLTAIMDRPLPRAEPPSFVGADAVSFTAMNMDFGRVVPVINGFLTSNPMMQAQFAESWTKMRPQLQQTFGALGSRMFVVQTSPQEVGTGELGTIVAVECADLAAFRTSFADFASQMGMEPREVAGHTMYVPGQAAPQGGPGMMGGMPGLPVPKMAFGIGDGYVFMGAEPEVVSALTPRAAGQGEGLVNSLAYRRSLPMLPDEPVVAWGFTDVAKVAEAAGQMGDGAPKPPGLAIDPQLIGQLVGPSVWYTRSTSDGFVSVAHQLPAPQAVHVETDQP
ncbi:MAG: hypothetical protein ACYTJ0_16505 [Planctomycetota bacterium]|jgi:hypothetical protein